MSSFCDNQGRTWRLDLTVESVRRIHAATGLHLPLLAARGGRAIPSALCHARKVVEVVYTATRDAANAALCLVTPDEFGAAMIGCLPAARAALLAALVEFFPEASRLRGYASPCRGRHKAHPAGMGPDVRGRNAPDAWDRMTWRRAARAGVPSPGPYSLRQLAWMGEAMEERQAELIAAVYNAGGRMRGWLTAADLMSPAGRPAGPRCAFRDVVGAWVPAKNRVKENRTDPSDQTDHGHKPRPSGPQERKRP